MGAETLAGRVALVTGSSRGIGRGIALMLARRGAAVAVNYRRDADAAAEVVAEIEAGGGRAVALGASLDDPEQVDALARDAVGALGPIDLLVHNAGIASRGLPVAETDRDEVERVMQVHALSIHRLTRLLLPGLRAARRGDVIVISSSEVAQMRANGSPYNMAKAALEAFALTLAHEELQHGVRVNIVAPGLVATDMGDRLVRHVLGASDARSLDDTQPLGRVVRPEDVAEVVCFFASEAASLVTAQRVIIDGGVDYESAGR
jgi:NAD(P)-dependent dehydrogenase (short-subunit alcohol dehydrogenase family)